MSYVEPIGPYVESKGTKMSGKQDLITEQTYV